MNHRITLLAIFILAALTFPPLVQKATAQNSQWGAGIAMGAQQNCGYPQKAGSGAVSESDEVNEILQAQKEEKRKQQEMQRKKKTLDREIERLHADIEKSLESEAADFAFNHMENGRRCDDYQTVATEKVSKTASKGNYEEDEEEPLPSERSQAQNKLPVSGLSIGDVRRYCDVNKPGNLNVSLCDDNKYRNTEGGGRSNTTCKKALPDYRKKYAESQKLADDIEGTESRLERYKEDLVDARRQAKEDRQNGITEGDICVDCMANGNGYITQQRQTDWAGVAANVGTGLAAMYAGYKTNKMVAEYNSDLGWPTQANASVASVGYPFLAAGLYGALGGGTGQGSFGCGSSGNGMGGGSYGNMNGGAFGYPQSMYGSPMSGGMYSTGMGSWGASGPNNMGLGGSIYGGMMVNGGLMSSSYPQYGGMSNSGLMASGSFGLMANTGLMSNYGSMYGSAYGSMLSTGSMFSDSSAQLQQYQQQLQSSMARAQTMTALQSELQSLMYKIQTVQYGGTVSLGASGTGYLSTGTYSSSGVLPAPTNYSTGLTTSGVLIAPTATTSVYGR